jgi:hypothetical protein
MKRQVDRYGLDQFLGGFFDRAVMRSGGPLARFLRRAPGPIPRSFTVEATDPALTRNENRTC